LRPGLVCAEVPRAHRVQQAGIRKLWLGIAERQAHGARTLCADGPGVPLSSGAALVFGKAAFWHVDPNAALLRRVEP